MKGATGNRSFISLIQIHFNSFQLHPYFRIGIVIKKAHLFQNALQLVSIGSLLESKGFDLAAIVSTKDGWSDFQSTIFKPYPVYFDSIQAFYGRTTRCKLGILRPSVLRKIWQSRKQANGLSSKYITEINVATDFCRKTFCVESLKHLKKFKPTNVFRSQNYTAKA